MALRVLAINPGSTSTKIAVFDDQEEILNETIRHPVEEIEKFGKITDQFDFRSRIVTSAMERAGIPVSSLSGVIGRGGLLKSIPGGVWVVNEAMIEDLQKGERGEHASNLGGIIAAEIAKKAGEARAGSGTDAPASVPAFIADPVVVDEMEDAARIAGHPEFERLSIFHALNQKAVARRAAAELGRWYDELNLIIIHLGGGISVGAHRKGRVIDVNNALNGEGPFSPERSGTLPAAQLVEMCFSGRFSKGDVMKKLKGLGGMRAYLDTTDGREAISRAESGDRKAELVMEAMVYQVAKETGAMATVLKGEIDGIILTGGLAYNDWLMERLISRISFLGRIFRYPGENEVEALRDAALRALRGEENPRVYS